MAKNDLQLKISVDSKTGEIRVEEFRQKVVSTGKDVEKTSKKITESGHSLGSYARSIAGWGSLYDLAVSGTQQLIAGTFALGRSVIQAGASWQTYQGTLETVTGSQAAAADLLSDLQTLADKTPYTTDQLVQAATKLEAYGIKTRDVITVLGDTAAGMGKPLDSAVEAMADAVVGEFERLKEFGVRASMEGSKTYLQYIDKTGKEAKRIVDRNNPAMIQAVLSGIWNERYAGGMERLSQTFEGKVSTLKSKIQSALQNIAASGAMDGLMRIVDELIGKFNRWASNGDLERWAHSAGQAIGEFARVTYHMGVGLANAIAIIHRYRAAIASMAVFYTGWKVWSKWTDGAASFMAVCQKLPAILHGVTGRVVGLSVAVAGLLIANEAILAWSRRSDAGIAQILRENEAYSKVNQTAQRFVAMSPEIRAAWRTIAPEGGVATRWEKFQAQAEKGVFGEKIKSQLTQYQKEMAAADDKTKGLTGSFKDLGAGTETAADRLGKFGSSLGLLDMASVKQKLSDFTQLLPQVLAQAGRSPEFAEKIKEQLDSLTKEATQVGLALPAGFTAGASQVDAILARWHPALAVMPKVELDWDKYVKDIPMPELPEFELDEPISSLDRLIDRLGACSETARDFGEALDGAAALAQALGLQSESAERAISGMLRGTDMLSGGVKRATDVLRAGGSLLKALPGIAGAAAGAVNFLSSAIGGLKAAFKGDGVGEAIKRENHWMNLTKEQTKQLRELEKQYKSVHTATSVMLDEMIKDADITTANIDQWADRVREVLSDLDQGKLSASQTAKELGESWNAIIAHAQRLGTEGSASLLNIIRDVRSRGLDVAEISDYIAGKLKSGIGALGNYYKAIADQAGYDRAAQHTMSLFAALRAEGASTMEALSQMGDSMTALREAAEKGGYKVPAGIRELMDLQTKLSANQGLVDAVSATKTMMEALGDTGRMTAEDMGAFGADLLKQFADLQAAGLTEKQTLEALGPSLSKLLWYSQQYGFALDAQTQALVDQAKANGTLTEIAIPPQEKMVSCLEQLVEILGGKIPYAVDRMAEKVKEKFSAMGTMASDLRGDWDDLSNVDPSGATRGSPSGSASRPLPSYANGGTFWASRPQAIVVGDNPREPELVQVTPRSQLQQSDNAPRNVQVDFHMHFPDIATPSVAAAIVDALKRNEYLLCDAIAQAVAR